MRKECFTCVNKLSTELTEEERKKIRDTEKAMGVRFPRVSKMIFHCKITGKRINQTDPACDDYQGDDLLLDIRKGITETAKKLRQELNDES